MIEPLQDYEVATFLIFLLKHGLPEWAGGHPEVAYARLMSIDIPRSIAEFQKAVNEDGGESASLFLFLLTTHGHPEWANGSDVPVLAKLMDWSMERSHAAFEEAVEKGYLE